MRIMVLHIVFKKSLALFPSAGLSDRSDLSLVSSSSNYAAASASRGSGCSGSLDLNGQRSSR